MSDEAPGVRFDLATVTDLRFGAGRVAELAAAVRDLGVSRLLVVTGATTGRADAARRELAAAGVPSEAIPVVGEPTVAMVRDVVAAARDGGCDGVLGYGGGSALDVAKAVAVLAGSGTDPLDHLEVVGAGRPVTGPALPCVAVPTTAGTGSEVTRNAVLAVDGVKASLRSPWLLPRLALVDPDLLVGLPAATVATSGMDALSQLIEPYLSRRANPLTDALAREGIGRSARSLRRAWTAASAGEPTDPSAREDLALASLFGGLALANAGLGAVHGFAAAAGARIGAPHGAVCAVMLSPVLTVTLAALRERAPGHPALGRLDEIGMLLTGDPTATATDALRWLDDLRRTLQIPGLAGYGVDGAVANDLLAQARRASSTRAHPIELTDSELADALQRAR